jgi:uncharacterized BrkB/YihY/UPF0761 family membrane protein
MSRHITNHWQNEISIYHENIRFAFMFIFFTLFAFLITIILFILANKSYQNHSEIFQKHFIPYYILASISLALFLIFFIGSLIYIIKSLSSNRSLPSRRSILKQHSTNLSCQTDV